MSDFTPEDGSIDRALLNIVARHIEQPMKTAVAFTSLLEDNLENSGAREIATAAVEETIVDLVTSAIALMTASWAQAGHDILLNEEVEKANMKWVSDLIETALDEARVRFANLRIDFAFNVGPIPARPEGN